MFKKLQQITSASKDLFLNKTICNTQIIYFIEQKSLFKQHIGYLCIAIFVIVIIVMLAYFASIFFTPRPPESIELATTKETKPTKLTRNISQIIRNRQQTKIALKTINLILRQAIHTTNDIQQLAETATSMAFNDETDAHSATIVEAMCESQTIKDKIILLTKEGTKLATEADEALKEIDYQKSNRALTNIRRVVDQLENEHKEMRSQRNRAQHHAAVITKIIEEEQKTKKNEKPIGIPTTSSSLIRSAQVHKNYAEESLDIITSTGELVKELISKNIVTMPAKTMLIIVKIHLLTKQAEQESTKLFQTIINCSQTVEQHATSNNIMQATCSFQRVQNATNHMIHLKDLSINWLIKATELSNRQ